MAKTFKNLPRPGEPAASKPTSERDFFDLIDDHSSEKKPAEQSETVHNTGNTANEASGASTLSSVATTSASAQDGVRQTFVLSRGHLEQLRDYVHARRTQGEYNYSQRQALQDALDLLFASAAPAAPRPAYAREQEEQRRQRIQRGRQSGISG